MRSELAILEQEQEVVIDGNVLSSIVQVGITSRIGSDSTGFKVIMTKGSSLYEWVSGDEYDPETSDHDTSGLDWEQRQ